MSVEEVYSRRCGRFYKDLTGTRLGEYTITGEGYVKNKNRRVPVRCSCGTEKEVYLQSLLKAKSLSCGCIAAEQSSKRLIERPIAVKLPDGVAALNSLYSSYKHLAGKRHYAWGLTKGQFIALTKGDCAYCGAVPGAVIKTAYKSGSYVYNGIDRKDNTKGYEPGNVVSCCTRCNRAKGAMGMEVFRDWIKLLHERMPQWAY